MAEKDAINSKFADKIFDAKIGYANYHWKLLEEFAY